MTPGPPTKLGVIVELELRGLLKYPPGWGQMKKAARTEWAEKVWPTVPQDVQQQWLQQQDIYAESQPETKPPPCPPSRIVAVVPFWVFDEAEADRAEAARATLERLARQVDTVAVEVAMGPAAWRLDHQPAKRIRTASALWPKEAAINAAVRELPEEFDAVAWIDADVQLPDDWPAKAIEGLRTCLAMQLWSRSASGDQSVGAIRSITRGHAGYAWAARRSLWSDGPGLFDRDLGGDNDAIMAACLLGQPDRTPERMTTSAIWWAESVLRTAKADGVGLLSCLAGSVSHSPHVLRQRQGGDLIAGRDTERTPEGLWCERDKATEGPAD